MMQVFPRATLECQGADSQVTQVELHPTTFMPARKPAQLDAWQHMVLGSVSLTM